MHCASVLLFIVNNFVSECWAITVRNNNKKALLLDLCSMNLYLRCKQDDSWTNYQLDLTKGILGSQRCCLRLEEGS